MLQRLQEQTHAEPVADIADGVMFITLTPADLVVIGGGGSFGALI